MYIQKITGFWNSTVIFLDNDTITIPNANVVAAVFKFFRN